MSDDLIEKSRNSPKHKEDTPQKAARGRAISEIFETNMVVSVHLEENNRVNPVTIFAAPLNSKGRLTFCEVVSFCILHIL